MKIYTISEEEYLDYNLGTLSGEYKIKVQQRLLVEKLVADVNKERSYSCKPIHEASVPDIYYMFARKMCRFFEYYDVSSDTFQSILINFENASTEKELISEAVLIDAIYPHAFKPKYSPLPE